MNTNLTIENLKKKWWAIAALLVVGVLGYKYAPLFHNEDPLGVLKKVSADPSLSFNQKLDKFSEIRKVAMPINGKTTMAGVSGEDKDSMIIVQVDLLKIQVETLDDLGIECKERQNIAKLIVAYCDTLTLYEKNTNELLSIKREAETQLSALGRQVEALERITTALSRAETDISNLSQLLTNYQRTYAGSKELNETFGRFKSWIIEAADNNQRTLPTIQIQETARRFKVWFDLFNQWNRDEEIKATAITQLEGLMSKADALLDDLHPEKDVERQLIDKAKTCLKDRALNIKFSEPNVRFNSPSEDVETREEDGRKIKTLSYEGEGEIKYFGFSTSKYRINGVGKITRNYFEGKDTKEIISNPSCDEL